jgi:hypothetical protein
MLNGEVKRLNIIKKECETYIDNYLFLSSEGFDLCDNKLALIFNVPFRPDREIEYMNLLLSQPLSTQNFVSEMNITEEIIKVVLLDKNNFCIIKSAIFEWEELEDYIVRLIKDCYLKPNERMKVNKGLFGPKEEDMAKVVKELSGEKEGRFPKIVIECYLA